MREGYLSKALLLCSVLIYTSLLSGQSVNPSINRLERSVRFLSSDSLQGRFPGSRGDSLAAFEIAQKLSLYGMTPLIGDSFLIPFELTLYNKLSNTPSFIIGEDTLVYKKDFWVSPLSPSLSYNGVLSNKEPGADEKGVVYIECASDSIKFLMTPLLELGYQAILFHDPDLDSIPGRINGTPYSIPVFSVTKSLKNSLSEGTTLSAAFAIETERVKATTFNIAGISAGRSKEYIMLGAHYDHLGLGEIGSGSVRAGENRVHPGADDNASGVSSILEIAKLIAPDTSLNKRVAIVAFGAEERGLLGSQLMSDTLQKLGFLPNLMINLDMVGRLREGKLQVGGVGTFQEASNLLEEINSEHKLQLITTLEGSGPSDHSSFNSKKVPVLYFTTGVHREYHSPADSASLINFEGLEQVTHFVCQMVKRVSLSNEEFAYIQQQESSTSTHKRGEFKISLGLIPDFTYEKGDGFKIGPVTEGKPAHKSGLKEGDLIVQIGEHKISNIYDYMSLLGSLKKGDSISVYFIRDGVKELVTINL